MSEHTSGPWKWHLFEYSDGSGSDSDFAHLSNASGALVLYGYGDNMDDGHVACSASNARLIAAAPELLEAAGYVLAHADRDPDTGLDAYTYNEAWEMLEDAVDKAEGQNE